MPRSRKRHLSRSRSKTRSRSPSPDRNHEKSKKVDSHEKDGKRRRLDELIDSPQHKRSLSFNGEETAIVDLTEEVVQPSSSNDTPKPVLVNEDARMEVDNEKEDGDVEAVVEEDYVFKIEESMDETIAKPEKDDKKVEDKSATKSEMNDVIVIEDTDTVQIEVLYDKKENITTPKKAMTPKQLQKKIESEKKKQAKQRERDERERQKQEEKAKILAERQKLKEQKEAERQKLLDEKQKQLELKQKEKEMKEELKRKEKEEKEQKRKEWEAQRREKEQERLKKLQELEEKNKEKLKEVEKKQKSATLFKNFFKKADGEEKEKKENKIEKINSNFMPFEVKSDMKMPPLRRKPLSEDAIKEVDFAIENQDEEASYLKDLKGRKIYPGKSLKTWPYEESDEVVVVDEDKMLGETIDEDKSEVKKMKAKFLYFHENKRPAYFGTWRKKSKSIKPRRPFEEDTDFFNYEEDSDDDWEEEEQGESLEISGDEEEKDTDNDGDEYEVDNELFVPHGHLSDDEVDDEENARLSPESLKQKLKLLKDAFEEDIKSKTHKLKPRSIGCIWFDKSNDNVDDPIYKYLLPLAMIVNGPIEIKDRSEIFVSPSEKKKVKTLLELPVEHIPFFLKIIHGNMHKKRTVIEEFITFMANNGTIVEVSKAHLTRFLKSSASYRKCVDNGPMKNKYGWFVNDDIKEKYNVDLDLAKA